MPGITISKKDFLNSIHQKLSDDEIEKILFSLGIEMDIICEDTGVVVYKLDIAANRYDLLCLEGLAKIINTYLHGSSIISKPIIRKSSIKVIQESVSKRPFIACGIIRNARFNYKHFIEYQDKLHQTIGRNRSAVAIGTHDLDKFYNGKPIKYKTIKLNKLCFQPLNISTEIKGTELKTKLGCHLHQYIDLLGSDEEGIIFEYDNHIISMPPIINSEFSKIEPSTTNIFIEVTGTDYNKVDQVLKLMLLNFNTGIIEQVEIQKENSIDITPVFNVTPYVFTIDEICKKIGFLLQPDTIKLFLEKMQYAVEIKNDQLISIPSYNRLDIIYKCDIIEDILIGYGFENIPLDNPIEFYTIGKENDLNKFSDKIREEIAMMGFNEMLTLTLLNKTENIMHDYMVEVEYPKSKEYEVVRTSLLPGLFKTLSINQNVKLPIQLFEISDVVLLDSYNRSFNKRFLTGVCAQMNSKLEEILEVIISLFKKLNLIVEFTNIITDSDNIFLKEKWEKYFIKNQTASIYVSSYNIPRTLIGCLGVVHPTINMQFKISLPISAFEIDLEKVFVLIKNII